MRVVVVGGGSSGWIAAATLATALNRDGRRAIELIVIESPEVGRIGVGEATIPTMRNFLADLGIEETDFLTRCDATFKQGIRFEDWAARGHAYMHPFHRVQGPESSLAGAIWLQGDGEIPFADLVSPQRILAEAGLAPRRFDDPPFGGDMAYAYHLDAELFAERLAERAIEAGAQRVSAHVVGVETMPEGTIAAVRTADGRRFEADLFIDCTGFRRLLIGSLRPGYVDFSDRLLCDRAIAMRVPYEVYRPPNIAPYTRARALENGWAWDIGLANRRGRGYVYASAFLDDDAAEARLRALEGPHAADLPARRLRFEVGRLERAWCGNCVAIGLSAGFVEPLESTGLHLSEFAARMLVEHFPLVENRPGLARRFNDIMAADFDAIVDFICLHYVLSQRRDTAFWRAASDPARRSDTLAAFLDLWEARPPGATDFASALQVFSHQNYEFVLYGMGWRPGCLRGPLVGVSAAPSPDLAAMTGDLRRRLPPHETLLAQLRASRDGWQETPGQEGFGEQGFGQEALVPSDRSL